MFKNIPIPLRENLKRKTNMPNLLLSSIKTAVGGLTSIKDVDKHLRKTLSQLVKQINNTHYAVPVLAEVKKVYATEKDLETDDDGIPKYEYLGGIEFKEVTKKSGISQGIPAKSLNSNLRQTPVEGEYVLIQKLFGEYYYSPQVNLFNSPNNSSYQGFTTRFKSQDSNRDNSETIETDNTGIAENKSANQVRTLGDKFLSNFNLRQVIPEEGNVILNGRFGNSVRLGSNIKNGFQNSPNIKLRAGRLQDATKFGEESLIEELDAKPINAGVEENINSDGSSMWMTTDETVRLTPATLEDNNIYPTEVVPEEFGGKQIILNSGRLIFNSKENGILGFSNGPIDFSTLNSFGVAAKQYIELYSPNVTIGRTSRTKNVNLRTSDFTVRGDSGTTLVRANKIRLIGQIQNEDIRRAGKGQPVARPITNEFGPKGEEAASFIVGPGEDIQVSKAVKGNELKEVLKEILEMQKVTTKAVQDINAKVLTPLLTAVTPLVAGATAAPLQASANSLANITTNVISDINVKIETLPKILSKVVEIE